MPQLRQILTLDNDDITALQDALAGKAVEKVVAGVRADLKASTVEPRNLSGDLNAAALAGLAASVQARREALGRLDTAAARELLAALARAAEVVAAAVQMLPPTVDPELEPQSEPAPAWG